MDLCRIFHNGVPSTGPEKGDFCWLDLQHPTEERMAEVAERLDLDELIVEDAVTARQRPKVERYDSVLFVVMRTVAYTEAPSDPRQIIRTGEVHLVIGTDFLLSVRHGVQVPGLIERMDRPLALEDHGPFALAWCAADTIVEEYLRIADELEEDLNDLEEAVFNPSSNFHIDEIYQLKREVLEMRHSLDPLPGALNNLLKQNKDLLSKEVRSYFRDVADNANIARDRVVSCDERLSALIDAGAAKISLQQNQDMRKLSVLVGMVALPTLIAGIYGMNFERMPELSWPLGYPLALLAMLVSVLLVWWICRKRGWV
ncbi:magnesium and cobalt transport protein CorA [Corynebacterium lowii]|uniref:Magnesium transport protein CorA n=1 Tax=Corynebacterium lowii TaxID=1544413 RepID=A0A0N8W049_9CORY|nr:magnesium and cobalt transport protein CorA [Corynebacterium lowii]KQB85706.1 Magnesium transport protein CorA [Corynebacterium lowii]MDP9851007.1 magnesium transporter [Corynebacterium lowii]